MTVLIDTPVWPGPRGWLFAHLVSDHSYGELHEFARELGLSARAFDRDHYDVPEHLHSLALALGAEHVSGQELVTRLKDAGLRRPRTGRRAVDGPRHGRSPAPVPGSPKWPDNRSISAFMFCLARTSQCPRAKSVWNSCGAASSERSTRIRPVRNSSSE